MIGGSPMMMMPSPYAGPPPGSYPQAYPYQQPYGQPYAPRNVQGRAAVPASTPIPILRTQMPEPSAPPPPPVRLPSPEQLGIGGGARSGADRLDWNAVHRRMEEVGIQTHLLAALPGGGYRLSCWIPTGKPGELRRIEAESGSRAEVFRLALEQAAKGAH